MTFYNFDFKDMVKGKYELWAIEEIISFSSLVYRLKDLATNTDRQGYGCDVGLRSLYRQFHYDLSDREAHRLRFDQAFRGGAFVGLEKQWERNE